MIDGYKRGGKVKKGKKVKKVKKVVRRKSTAKRALPPLTTGTLGTGTGSYQATIGTGAGSGGAFQAPSYFRAVGSSEQYGVVPPVLREFIEQQKKMLDDIKKNPPKQKSPPALPPSSAPVPAPVPAPVYSSSGQIRRGTGAYSILSSGSGSGSPSYFPPASGASMKPNDANIDSPSSNYVPLRASRPDDLSVSAAMASTVASSASSAMASMSSTEALMDSASDGEGKDEESVNIPKQVLPKKIKIPRTTPGRTSQYIIRRMKEQERERQQRESQEQSQESEAPSSPRTAMRRGIARLDALQASGAF